MAKKTKRKQEETLEESSAEDTRSNNEETADNKQQAHDDSDEHGESENEHVAFPSQELIVTLARYGYHLLHEQIQTHPYRIMALAFGAGFALSGGGMRTQRSAWYKPFAKMAFRWVAAKAFTTLTQQVFSKMGSPKTMQRGE